MQFNYRGIFGPDVSYYQADPRQNQFIDFDKMKSAGPAFVIIKAGQFTYADPAFAYNWKAAKLAGLLRSAYWFLDKDGDAKAQARLFWSLLKDDPGEGPLVVDFEDGSGNGDHLYNFLVELRNLSNYDASRIWIYTGYFYWLDHTRTDPSFRYWFKKFGLWIAAYSRDASIALKPEDVNTPYPWDTAVMWQQGTLIVPGPSMGVLSKEIDYNVFNGGWTEFITYFVASDPSPIPIPGGNTTMEYKVTWTQGVARRFAPTTSNSYTGLTPYANMTVVSVIEENIPDKDDPTNPKKKWVKFSDGYYGASLYPDSTGIARTRMEKIVAPAPAPSAKIVKAVIYFDDGTTQELFV